MTTYDAKWVAAEQAKRAWMANNGMYSESQEHASCGVGLAVAIDGAPSRDVVEHGIAALKAIWHHRHSSGVFSRPDPTHWARAARG